MVFTLHQLLKSQRQSLRLKIKDIASWSGIDQALVSKFENGSRLPTEDQLSLLSKAYKLEYSQLRKFYFADKVYRLLSLEVNPNEVIDLAKSRIEYLLKKEQNRILTIDPEIRSQLLKLDEKRLFWKKIHTKNKIHETKIEEYFSLSYTHESNKIEGNTLTLHETMMVIKEGITISGKTMNEHLEAINHSEAIEFIKDVYLRKAPFTESVLLQIHALILRGIDRMNAGRYRNVNVRILGSAHVPSEPYLVPKLIEDYFHFYQKNVKSLHPVILAAELHERLVTIHPFIDGNGRTARLVMNLILIMNGYPLAILKGEQSARRSYFDALQRVQSEGYPGPFYLLIIDRLIATIDESIDLLTQYELGGEKNM